MNTAVQMHAQVNVTGFLGRCRVMFGSLTRSHGCGPFLVHWCRVVVCWKRLVPYTSDAVFACVHGHTVVPYLRAAVLRANLVPLCFGEPLALPFAM